MPDILGFLLGQGSMIVVVAVLIVAGLGVPIPEDIPLLVSGVLVQRGVVSAGGAFAACAFGVFVGDTMIFLFARRLGPQALEVWPFRKLLTPARREKIEHMFARHGNLIVFMARHMAGLRAPTFAMAGIHGMPLAQFWLWDGLGLCVSAPVIMFIGYLLADNLDTALEYLDWGKYVIMGLIVVGGVVWWRKSRRKPMAERAPLP